MLEQDKERICAYLKNGRVGLRVKGLGLGLGLGLRVAVSLRVKG